MGTLMVPWSAGVQPAVGTVGPRLAPRKYWTVSVPELPSYGLVEAPLFSGDQRTVNITSPFNSEVV